jgi:hypothetical protein
VRPRRLGRVRHQRDAARRGLRRVVNDTGRRLEGRRPFSFVARRGSSESDATSSVASAGATARGSRDDRDAAGAQVVHAADRPPATGPARRGSRP